MANFKTPTVTADVWRDGDETTPGVKIRQGKHWTFIPMDAVLEVLDQAHDVLEAHEGRSNA